MNEFGEKLLELSGNSDGDCLILGNESFLFFLLLDEYISMSQFSILISKKINKTKILQYSETLLTSIITSELLNIDNITILGVDTLLYEYIDNIKVSSRCYICFKYLNKLYIIENKYSTDKIMYGKDAHNCLITRRYPNRVLN